MHLNSLGFEEVSRESAPYSVRARVMLAWRVWGGSLMILMAFDKIPGGTRCRGSEDGSADRNNRKL